MMELQYMATLLDEHEDEFAEALEKKANADSIKEKQLAVQYLTTKTEQSA